MTANLDIAAIVNAAQPATGVPCDLGRISLPPIVRGELTAAQPGVIYRDDGQGLLYPGALHDLIGEPGVGKSWLTYFAFTEVLRAGGAVLALDYEGTAHTFVERLRYLGVDDEVLCDESRVAYHNLVGKSSPVQVAALACELDNVGVVAIDSMLPALIRNGLDDNSNSDLAAFYDVIARPLTAGGAPVVTVDHLTKDAANRTRGARGAGAKLQLVDVSYTVKLTKSFSKTREGDFKITCAKDRFGTFGIGETVADVTVTPYLDDSVTIHVGAPATVDPEKPFRPTRIMENISRALEESGPLNTNALRTAARGDDKVKPLARTLLVNEGYIAEEHVGRESIYSSLKPYRVNEGEG